MPFESMPYAAPVLYDPRQSNDRITELLMRQGDIAARGAAAQGDIWGNTVAGLGQQVGGALQKRSEDKRQQEHERLLTEAFNAFDPLKPQEGFKKLAAVAGPKDALTYVNGLIGLAKLSQAPDDPEAFKRGIEGAATMLRQPNGEQMLANQWSTLRPLLAAGAKQRGIELQDTFQPEYAGLIKDYASQHQETEHVDAGDRIVILDKHTGKEVGSIKKTEPTKPDTRNIDERIADATLAGDTAKANALLNVKHQIFTATHAPEQPTGPSPQEVAEKKDEIEGWLQTLEQGGHMGSVPAKFKTEVNKAYQAKHGERPLSNQGEADKQTALNALEDQINEIEEAGKAAIAKYNKSSIPGLDKTGAFKTMTKVAGGIASGEVGIPLPWGLPSIDLGKLTNMANTDPEYKRLKLAKAGLSTIARAQGEKGALSNQDVERVSETSYKLGESEEQLQEEIKTLRNIVKRGRAAIRGGK